ncbi:hypothetical protein PITCH_A1380003 [uncultured Desulfobacterium sp.]|uniref:Uncharacterized protein n=1 Tax=uncultured Desulfobacterium sp. TaxID=201089 RepID=A0A445MSN4_9BACT|nr:hypothetical protein PITCH_A1380003 [uncultured Desulfobacterium sp.]
MHNILISQSYITKNGDLDDLDDIVFQDGPEDFEEGGFDECK